MRHTFLHRTAATAATVTALVVLAGCGGGSSSTATSPTTPAGSSSSSSSGGTTSAAAVITIKNFAFSGPASVKAGATITVKNEDGEAHTVTADDSSGGFDVKIDGGKSATFTAPSKPGTYAYHCTYHSNMHGTLKVS